jgi:hypothetical protein
MSQIREFPALPVGLRFLFFKEKWRIRSVRRFLKSRKRRENPVGAVSFQQENGGVKSVPFP